MEELLELKRFLLSGNISDALLLVEEMTEKAKGNYCEPSELRETIEEAYDIALDAAAGEAFEGKYESAELGVMVDRDRIIQEAIALVSGGDV